MIADGHIQAQPDVPDPAPVAKLEDGRRKELVRALRSLPYQQRKFIRYLAEGNSRTAAARLAGYATTWHGAKDAARRIAQNPRVRNALKILVELDGLTLERIVLETARVAFGPTIADYEPFLTGEKSLQDLEAAGIDPAAIESATISRREGKYGPSETRSISRAKKIGALVELAKLRGFAKDEPPPPAPGQSAAEITAAVIQALREFRGSRPVQSRMLTDGSGTNQP